MPDTDADARFVTCLPHVLKHEGGYADHPKDPGGATNLGITHKTLARWRGISPWWKLPKAEVKALKQDEAGRIYQSLYWQPAKAPDSPPGLDLTLFDFAVNSGPARAAKALQAELKVKVDGLIGPLTLRALKARIAIEGAAGLIAALSDRRLTFLQKLATYAVFGRGWSRRVNEIRTTALKMAGAPSSTTTARTNSMTLLSGYKTYIIAGAMLITGVAGLLGIEIPSFSGQAPGGLVMEALAFIFLRQGLKTDITKA